MQLLDDTVQINTDNLNIVIGETNRHFGKKNTRKSLKVILITLK